MADVYSENYVNENAAPPVNMHPVKRRGRIRSYEDSYLQGAVAGNIGDVIKFGMLPSGARLLDGKVFFGTGTTNATLALGIAGDAVKFMAATNIATAGSGLAEAHMLAGYSVPIGGIELIGTNAVAAIAANQRITVRFRYVVD